MNTSDTSIRHGVSLRFFLHVDARHQGKLPVVVALIPDKDAAAQLLARVRKANAELVYTHAAIEYGVLGKTTTG